MVVDVDAVEESNRTQGWLWWVMAGVLSWLLALGLNEVFLTPTEVRLGVRWALLFALPAAPVLWKLYEFGLGGGLLQAVLFLCLGMAFKLSLLLLGGAMLFLWFEANLTVFSFLLFFLLFGFSFLMIYLLTPSERDEEKSN